MTQPLFIRREKTVKGPFPAGQIAQFLLVGRFKLTDEVSVDREEWKPIKSCPELIPDVLKGDPDDAQAQDRLAAARRWADERRPSVQGAAEEHRKSPESDTTLEYRKHRESIYKRLSQRKDAAAIQAIAVLLLVAASVYIGFSFMPEQKQVEADCKAPPSAGVDWRYCRLAGTIAIKQDLSGAILNSAILTGSNFYASNFKNAILDYADLSVSDLSFAVFARASLKGANLQQADLTKADFTNAKLNYVDFTGAKIKGMKLTGAKLDNAIWVDGQRCLAGSIGACNIH